MNKPFTPQPSNRSKGLALSIIMTLAMLVSVDMLATTDAPAAQIAAVQSSQRG